MGRKRVEIKKIGDKARRQTTFTKRRDGLFKKMADLCKMCEVEGAIITFTEVGNIFAFGNPSVDHVIQQYVDKTSDSNGAQIDDNNEKREEEEEEEKEKEKEARGELGDKHVEILARLEAVKNTGEMVDEALPMVESFLLQERVNGFTESS
ncbi:agamous-like MADS-box protein AGL23 isoform X2 [Diospyros lotus]|nr:agamous-like MADS-box protein AGL23 isoform X2 [Diospyros lotus]XP_052208428.1 agamous-like MADS-box protein AGL23 isoform X2 [Diospyros lotus]